MNFIRLYIIVRLRHFLWLRIHLTLYHTDQHTVFISLDITKVIDEKRPLITLLFLLKQCYTYLLVILLRLNFTKFI